MKIRTIAFFLLLGAFICWQAHADDDSSSSSTDSSNSSSSDSGSCCGGHGPY